MEMSGHILMDNDFGSLTVGLLLGRHLWAFPSPVLKEELLPTLD